MIKIITILSFFILCFQPREAVTSQVMYRDSEQTLAEVAGFSTDFVVVKNLGKIEVYLEKPIKVPGKGIYKYQELVDLYEVITVVKSDKIKPGQIIKIWTEPAYNYEATRAYYVDGEFELPIIDQYKPVHEPKDGENRIMFLNDKDPEKAVYRWRASEGLETLPDLEAILKNPPTDMPVTPE